MHERTLLHRFAIRPTPVEACHLAGHR
jgi:hypothetical protein